MDSKYLSVPVQVDVKRLLRVDMNTMCDAEKEAGISFLENMRLPLSFNGMRALCWASWRKEDPSITLERTGEILQEYWMVIMGGMVEAWNAAMPDAEPRAVDPTPPTTTAPS
jgi:hypothetical protein